MVTAYLLTIVLAGQPAFEVVCKRNDDDVAITAQTDRVLLTVTSPRGIGAATIHRRQVAWPARVILRLHLRGLESLTVVSGQVTWGLSVSSSPPHATRLHVSQADPTEEKSIDGKSPYWTDVRVLDAEGQPASGLPKEGGWFELTLPAELLAQNPSTLEIRWIDFYRN